MGRQSEFDAYADDYDAALGQGLAVSGEGREFFATAAWPFCATACASAVRRRRG